jgi:hypothetical protein
MVLMNEDHHPAARLVLSVVALHRRATLTVVAFGAVMLARATDLVLREWSISLIRSIPDTGEGAGPELMSRLQAADGLVNAGNIAITITFITTAVVFLRWMHRLVVLTRALGGKLAWTPAQAVWAFFIPIISLIRPYQVLTAAHTALDPEHVAPPAPRVDPSAQRDYRSVAFVHPPPAPNLPKALIGFWWGAFVVMSVSGKLLTAFSTPSAPDAVISAYRSDMFVSFAAVVAAALAVTVVRGLTARVAERFRRIRESSPESLVEQRIVLS